jgi:hypothetical protein
VKKPRLNFDWEGPFSRYDTTAGWVIEGRHGLIVLSRLTRYEAEILLYALNIAYPYFKKAKK